MRTEETFGLMKSAKEIGVSLDADGDRIGGLLNEQSPLPAVDGEAAFDYRKHMQGLGLQLGEAKQQVVDAEDEHAARLIRVSRQKSDRDEVGKACYDKTVTTRQGLETLYPSGAFELAFLKGTTPRNPERLREQLVQSVKLLKNPAVEPREPEDDAFSVDLEKVVAKLEPSITDLSAAIDRYDRAKKEAEGSLVVKRLAIVQLRRTVVWVGRTTEGLFYLAGEDDLAKRIRKSTRRPLRHAEQKAEAAASEETPQSEDSPSEASLQAAAATSQDSKSASQG